MFVAHSPCLVILSEAVQSTAKSKDLRTENLTKKHRKCVDSSIPRFALHSE